MKIQDFNTIVNEQVNTCLTTLLGKGQEYAPDAVAENIETPGLIEEPGGQLRFDFDREDRLAHFKKAAVIMNATPKAALLGMLSKHLVSVSDMCMDENTYTLDRWTEKITDSINYLLILKAIVKEEHSHG